MRYPIPVASPSKRRPGWTGKIHFSVFHIEGDPKTDSYRPWCWASTRDGDRLLPERMFRWVPRSTDPEHEAGSISSPIEEVPGLDKPGWWVPAHYVQLQGSNDIGTDARYLGQIPPKTLKEIRKRLKDLYLAPDGWDVN